MRTVVEVLRGGKAAIQHRGRCTGRMEDPEGHICALGGLRIGMWDRVELHVPGGPEPTLAEFEVYEGAKKTLAAAVGAHLGGSLSYWNDHVVSTDEEVFAGFDKAIALAEAHGSVVNS